MAAVITLQAPLPFYAVNTDNNGWKLGSGTNVGDGGTWCDIHLGNVSTTFIQKQANLSNELNFNTNDVTNSSGTQLMIASYGLSRYTVGIYNLQGKRSVFSSLSGSSGNTISLAGLADGGYILLIKRAKVNKQTLISINR